MKKYICPLLLGIILATAFFPAQILAQDVPGDAPQARPLKTPQNAETLKLDDSSIETLESIAGYIKSLREELAVLQRQIKRTRNPEDKEKLASQAKDMGLRLIELERDFEDLATGIDIVSFDTPPEQTFNWQEELVTLVRPLFQQLRSMTARPRKLERLRREVDYQNQRLATARKALAKIETLGQMTKDKALKEHLGKLSDIWKGKEEEITNDLAVANLQLEELTKERTSFLESGQKALKDFFRTRGLNFIMAALAFTGMFLFLRFLHRIALRFITVSKEVRNRFTFRLCEIVYHAFTATAAVFAMLAVLYATGDWVLLSLAIIFLIGFGWTAKQGLPRYWEQIKLLLNVGSVRQGERIIYEGVPWRVENLNIFATLENPSFKGLRLRLPIEKLIGMTSRPNGKGEPWFPCLQDDWVILSDGTRGKVVSLTHEMVHLVLRGGARKTYPTQDFLSQTPLNISTNFRLKVTFGIDYALQAKATSEIPSRLEEFARLALDAEGYGKSLLNLRVEFEAASSSSLDLVFIADFDGKSAPLYNRIRRALQRIATDACSEYGWNIPFPQLTVHKAAD